MKIIYLICEVTHEVDCLQEADSRQGAGSFENSGCSILDAATGSGPRARENYAALPFGLSQISTAVAVAA